MSDLLIAVIAIFGTIALASGMVITYVMERRSVTRQRIAAIYAGQSSGVLLETPRLTAGVDPALKKLSTYIPKSPKEMNGLQRKMAMAGYHGARPVVIYCVAEVALAAIGIALPLLIIGLRGFMFAFLGGVIGYLLPSFAVQRKIRARKLQIQNGLPDALDLLIVCIEAGLGIDQAIVKVGEELNVAYPALSEELRMVNVEMRAGKPRLEAFKNFAKRTQVEDVRSLVTMLVQTDRFGTSVAQALRTHAETSRSKRKARAEEKAAKLGVKLVFPLVFCLLPAFFVVALGPAIITLVRFFGTVSFGTS